MENVIGLEQSRAALGYAFIATAAIDGVLAFALVARPHDRMLPLLAAVLGRRRRSRQPGPALQDA
jgi:hypothetical protein